MDGILNPCYPDTAEGNEDLKQRLLLLREPIAPIIDTIRGCEESIYMLRAWNVLKSIEVLCPETTGCREMLLTLIRHLKLALYNCAAIIDDAHFLTVYDKLVELINELETLQDNLRYPMKEGK